MTYIYAGENFLINLQASYILKYIVVCKRLSTNIEYDYDILSIIVTKRKNY